MLFGTYVPAPPDHTIPGATVKLPANVNVGLFAQADWGGPGVTVGPPINVILRESFTAGQAPLPVEVRYKYIDGFAKSATEGVKVVTGELAFAKVPVTPLLTLHVAPPAPVCAPFKLIGPAFVQLFISFADPVPGVVVFASTLILPGTL